MQTLQNISVDTVIIIVFMLCLFQILPPEFLFNPTLFYLIDIYAFWPRYICGNNCK